MSGMQDVATLADRYSSLSSTAQKLNRNIDRLKKEVSVLREVNVGCHIMLTLLMWFRRWSRTAWSAAAPPSWSAFTPQASPCTN